jgi:tyrosine-protein kinase Etk/Wzc
MMNNNNGSDNKMNNLNFDLEKYLHSGAKSAKDYILLIRNNLKSLILITLIIVALVAVYAILAKNIYKSTVTIRITQPNQNVLEAPDRGEPQTSNLDRYISNEIGLINNYNTREKIAIALIDSFNNSKTKDLFSIVKDDKDEGTGGHKSTGHLAGLLKSVLSVEQLPGTDVLELSAESPSPLEAALIANTAASEYQKINLEISRQKLTNVRKFLEKQAQEKLTELKSAEDTLMKFQESGGIVSLDIQSSGMLSQLSQLDAQKEATKIELSTSNEILKQYKFFLRKQDPQLVDYLENQTSQAYINALQQQLADLQVNRDLALSMKSPNLDITNKIKEYDQRIEELKEKLSAAIGTIKADAFSGNPDQVRDLAQRLIEEEIRNSTLSVRLEQLENATRKYEGTLRRLPKTSTALSQYQRERESLQQLFLLVNERYQEAMINELSQSGNAFIVNPGRVPDSPEKPNRILIILFGFLLGPIVAFGYLLIKDYFDDTVKTPEDIEKNDISFLSWIPQINSNGNSSADNNALSVLYDQDSNVSESFRAIRARIMHSKEDSEIPKIILVTSPAESEGKTFTSINLAGTFSKSNKKTLIIDCDLRRPQIHTVFGVDKRPGLMDYLSHKVKLEEVIRKTKTNNLNFITSGTLPSNPAEVLESKLIKNFLKEIKDFFDVIILDSPPIVAVIDAEILSKLADGTILVVSSERTENRLMNDAVEIIKRNKVNFLGTILNNFQYKSGYGYYYKYYYNYSRNSNQKGKKFSKSKT